MKKYIKNVLNILLCTLMLFRTLSFNTILATTNDEQTEDTPQSVVLLNTEEQAQNTSGGGIQILILKIKKLL